LRRSPSSSRKKRTVSVPISSSFRTLQGHLTPPRCRHHFLKIILQQKNSNPSATRISIFVMTLTRRVTRSSVRSATAQATFSAASYSPRRLRSSPHNISSTATSRGRATRSVSRPSATTSSDHANSDETNHPRRHSTRRAAVQARDRISAASLPQRAARGMAGASQATDTSSASNSTSPPRPGSLKSPIVLDDADDDEEEMDSKPAALPAGAKSKETLAAALGNNLLADFTCAICLDCPATCEEVAKISGCTHKFCFNCIDQWAKTENRCPCCKARFRTIERVVPLSEVDETVAAAPPGRGRKRKARRGLRERFRSPTANGAASAAVASTQVNSRTVEDRNQPVAGMAMSQEMVQHIIETLRQFRRDQNIGDGGNIQVQFLGMGGQRQPIIRIRSPSGAGGRVAGSQVQMLEFVMNLSGGEGGARTLSLTQIRGRGANGAAGRRGNSPRPAAAARGVSNAAGPIASIAPFHMGTSGGTNQNERRRRSISTTRARGSPAATSSTSRERNRQRHAGRFVFDVERVIGNGRTQRVGARSSPRTRSGRSPDQPVVLDE